MLCPDGSSQLMARSMNCKLLQSDLQTFPKRSIKEQKSSHFLTPISKSYSKKVSVLLKALVSNVRRGLEGAFS